MKVCVAMVGCLRPSSERIIKNIENNILYFRNTYPQHKVDFIVCGYINDNYNSVLDYCKKNKITNYFIPPIKDSDISTDFLELSHKNNYPHNNRYRMFYSNSYVFNKISDEYDAVVRLRIDTEIQSFQLFDNIKSNYYYTVIDTETSCSDNIGYGTLEVMKKVWDLKNCVPAVNNETAIFSSIQKNSYTIEQFNFDYILYQDNSDYFDNVRQWSKNNRRWIYDGKTYTRGIIV